MRYTRAELAGILATRWAARSVEAISGPTPWLDFRIRITPEMLDLVMRGEFVAEDGTRSRMVAVEIDAEGLATPVMEAVESVA